MQLDATELHALIRQIIQMQVTISSVAIATTIFLLGQLTEEKVIPSRIGPNKFSPKTISFYRLIALVNVIYAIVVPLYEITSYVRRDIPDTEFVGWLTFYLGLTFFLFACPLIMHLVALILDLK